jgi:starch phosphorylase
VSEVVIESLCDSLPRRVRRLGEIAYNLWWTWSPEAQNLFMRLDPVLWESVNHNPVRLLRQLSRSRLAEALADRRILDSYDRVIAAFDTYMRNNPGRDGQLPDWNGDAPDGHPMVAYFSFEFGLTEALPMYAGGLGVLAADHLKEASDMGLPMVGVGFLYLNGYFRQRITEDGWQEADYEHLNFNELPIIQVTDATGAPLILSVELPGRRVYFHTWKAQVGHVSLYLLDTDVAENLPKDRVLTQRLYSPDPETRINQEIVLGIGGVRALRALGINPAVWHMNEGHSAFSTLERARELVKQGMSFAEAREHVRRTTVFTTHTPVPAGNDRFPIWQIDQQLSGFWHELGLSREAFMALGAEEDFFGMTPLALYMSSKANGVSKLHGQVAREMWQWLYPNQPVPISHITNGVHTATWLARRMRRLFDEYLGPAWYDHLDDESTWRLIYEIPDDELWAVRKHLKRKLAQFMRERARAKWVTHSQHPVQTIASGVLIDPNALTIGFARRFATYKRAALILRDVPRLLRLLNDPARPIQIIFAGKAHPNDEPGKRLLQELYRVVKNASTAGRMVFIEDYDMNVARHLVQGVDVWLNTPRRPYEASGTSGMKAALNGAINFSVLDGWWCEAYDGKNGWAIGEDKHYSDPEQQDREDCESLFRTLEEQIIPLYYDVDEDYIPRGWLQRVKASIATIAPRFSTRRMLKQYVRDMYAPLAEQSRASVAMLAG